MVFVGDANVGKTSIIARYIKDEFVQTSTTVAAAFLSKNVVIDNVSFSVGVWDTAGQEVLFFCLHLFDFHPFPEAFSFSRTHLFSWKSCIRDCL